MSPVDPAPRPGDEGDPAATGERTRARRPTATQSFGSSRRESHDASAFYERFVPVSISRDDTVNPPAERDVIYEHDARDMHRIADNSVALVVTSPPYFAGKQYEESLGENGVPASYIEFLGMLRDVFAECARVLEPGGRIAVNVANLGRRPYRSLAGDVVEILQGLGLLLRGEVVWWKGRAAGGSCAWGTFQSPGNPVLRDVTERIVIASKGRFDRALTVDQRRARGLPHVASVTRDEFLEATTDLWELPTESATRVGHPAPFPVALPQRLIELYTYEDDLVLDPFMGSGSTAVAAVRTGRHFVGFDTDSSYVAAARARIDDERAALVAPSASPASDPFAAAMGEGRRAKEIARLVLDEAGFADVREDVKFGRLGVAFDFVARDATGAEWAFGVCGTFTTGAGGLKRVDTLWKAIGQAAVLHASEHRMPVVLLTTEAPRRSSAGHHALAALRGPDGAIADVVELGNDDDRARLQRYAATGAEAARRA